jgi:hypothetical protein
LLQLTSRKEAEEDREVKSYSAGRPRLFDVPHALRVLQCRVPMTTDPAIIIYDAGLTLNHHSSIPAASPHINHHFSMHRTHSKQFPRTQNALQSHIGKVYKPHFLSYPAIAVLSIQSLTEA